MYTLEICLLSVFPLFLSTYGTVLERRAEEVVLSYDFFATSHKIASQAQKQPIAGHTRSTTDIFLALFNLFLFSFSTRTNRGLFIGRRTQCLIPLPRQHHAGQGSPLSSQSRMHSHPSSHACFNSESPSRHHLYYYSTIFHFHCHFRQSQLKLHLTLPERLIMNIMKQGGRGGVVGAHMFLWGRGPNRNGVPYCNWLNRWCDMMTRGATQFSCQW